MRRRVSRPGVRIEELMILIFFVDTIPTFSSDTKSTLDTPFSFSVYLFFMGTVFTSPVFISSG